MSDLGKIAWVVALNLYVEPSSWPLHVGFALTSPKQRFPTIIGILIGVSLMYKNGEIQNALNIFRIADHSENIGVYFYISIEVFSEHMSFFLIAYQLFILVVLV